MKRLIIVLLLAGAVHSSALAQTPGPTPAPTPSPAPAHFATMAGVPDIVVNGFNSYLKGSYAEAINVWTKGSGLDTNTSVKSALNTLLSNTEISDEAFVGPELIKNVGLTQSSSLVYVFAKYKKGAMYFAFSCYKTVDNKWLVTSITANADPAQILPTNILSGQ